MTTAADSLFERILNEPDVFYRHQQCDEPDLSTDQKRTILSDLLTSNKALFLQRYGKYMINEDCALFQGESDPLIGYMIGQMSGDDRILKI
ncbi:hypothetical protein KIN20_007338 [Parelaphostrongylus tenuis]|uniref:CCD97-like C-terminal domain-containing protein n=1 Tax=Parelaphostrongylus tenuis TaxID=148309 RepID=A0AAD5M5B9_PARTN|nr:hypothetical protein KIN20_007338 [Parelaphostrongylus tenuis]